VTVLSSATLLLKDLATNNTFYCVISKSLS
jgi:hypothetical protein